MWTRSAWLCGVLAVASGCTKPPSEAASAGAKNDIVVQVLPAIETAPSAQDDGNAVAFWRHPTNAAQSVIVASGGTAGLELFELNGAPLTRYADAQIDLVAVHDGFELDGQSVSLIVGYDRVTGGLVTFTLDPDTRAVTRVSRRTLPTEDEATGLCLYRSALTGRLYAFAAVDAGFLQQWELSAQNGQVDGRIVRTLPVGFGAGHCAADDVAGDLYVGEETIGIWKYRAEPESDPTRTIVDLVQPRGGIEEEVKGIALYRADDATAYLLAADVKSSRLNVYDLGAGTLAGRFTVGATAAIDAVDDISGIAANGDSVAIVDDDNADATGNVKLVAWADIAKALSLKSAAAGQAATPTATTAKIVEPTMETQPVDDFGDAADDPAIWVDPRDPSKSLIIGTNKKRGLDVYDLSGKRVQSITDGRMNNVDLRDGFVLGGKTVSLVTASNRTNKSLSIYALDPSTRKLVDVAARVVPTELEDPYGLCMYRSAKDGAFYVFINDSADGLHRQWRLTAKDGKVDAERVRDVKVGTQAEGCVADDETGALYIAEEDVGLWRYGAEPNAGDTRKEIDKVGPGKLTADAEGLGLWRGKDGKGYVVLSNQGADNYAVYRREGDNAFVGFFSVVANNALAIDGVSETDGLDVTSASLGGGELAQGALVAQDGRNLTPNAKQNFKLVPWSRVAKALGLQ